MNKPIEPPLNGAERGYSDGTVELYVDGVDYRVLADNQVLIADYHDDGSIQGWTTCHALTEDELLRLHERAALLRKGA